MYLASQRREYILRLLEERGSIRSANLARELGVTDETVRTDLVSMAHAALLKRVHGGAEYLMPAPNLQKSDSRLATQLLALIREDLDAYHCIYLEDSLLCRALLTRMQDWEGRLVTNSPNLLSLMLPVAVKAQVSFCAGALDKQRALFVGALAQATLRECAPDLLILCPDRVYAEAIAYNDAAHREWLAFLKGLNADCFVLAPARCLRDESDVALRLPELFAWHYDCLYTEDALPDDFELSRCRLVPFVEPVIMGSENEF